MLVHFPVEETGKARKLSRPWHGPYRVVSVADLDVCASKVLFPQKGAIQVHQSRVKLCPPEFLIGFYWYGGKGPLPNVHPGGSLLCWRRSQQSWRNPQFR